MKIKYPILKKMMMEQGIGCWDIAKQIKAKNYITEKKLAGEMNMSDWEKIKIKVMLGTEITVKELFSA